MKRSSRQTSTLNGTLGTPAQPPQPEASFPFTEGEFSSRSAADRSLPTLDPLQVPRDSKGHRLNDSFHGRQSLVRDVPLKNTSLSQTIAAIRDQQPGRAGQLEHMYDHMVRPAVQNVRATQEDQQHRLDQRRQQVKRRNDEITSAQAELRTKRDAVTERDRQTLKSIEELQATERSRAAAAIAQTGREFIPQKVMAESLVTSPASLDVIRGKHDLPDPETRPSHLTKISSWAIAVAFGAPIGISIGLVGDFLKPDSLLLQPALLSGFVFLGVLITVSSKKALGSAAFLMSEAFHRQRRGRRWLFYAASGVPLASLLLLGDSAAERSGLLAGILHREMILSVTGQRLPAGSQAGNITYYLVPVLMMIGFIAACFYEGWLDGRATTVHNQAKALQQSEFDAQTETLHADPKIIEAAVYAALANEAGFQENRVVTRILEDSRPFDDAIQRLESQRLSYPGAELDNNALSLVQQAYDSAVCVQNQFFASLEDALGRCESRNRFLLSRLWHRLCAYLRRRHSLYLSRRRQVNSR